MKNTVDKLYAHKKLMVNYFLLFSLVLKSKQGITYFNAMVTLFGCLLPKSMIYDLEDGEATLGKQNGEIWRCALAGDMTMILSQDAKKKSQAKKEKSAHI